ncbi:hypothetical protein D3C86_2261050 [compost metagenome]
MTACVAGAALVTVPDPGLYVPAAETPPTPAIVTAWPNSVSISTAVRAMSS